MRSWFVLGALLLAFILVPFFALEPRLNAMAASLRERPPEAGWLALLLASLLALDVALPVPSSVVATLAGFALGFGGGAAVVWTGLMAGCAGGYWLGRAFGEPLARRFVESAQLAAMAASFERWGAWTLVLCRALPVLAEASVLTAGLLRLSLRRFLAVCALSNLGLATAYAGVGAYSAKVESFLLAFAGSLILPGIALLWSRLRE